MVELEVGSTKTVLAMVLDSGSPVSGLSGRSITNLADAGLLETGGRRSYVLRQLRVLDQAIPDLVVRQSRRAEQVGVDGILDLDFLWRFEEVHFHMPTMRLTLSRP
jgi:hypothetical protein